MHLSIRVVALATLLAQAASKTLQVNVGQQGIAFTPNTTQASIGDTIQFSFYNVHPPLPHT
jgi:plastocyanin